MDHISRVQTTKIGLTVNKLRKHNDVDIASQARALVKGWKRAVDTISSTATSATTTMAASPPSSTEPSSPPAQAAPPLSQARQRTRGLLERQLCQVAQQEKKLSKAFVEDNAAAAATKLEAALFRVYGGGDATDPSRDYREKVRSFHFNMRANIPLALKILLQRVEYDILAKTPSEELASEEFKQQQQRDYEEDLAERQLDWDKQNKKKLLESAGLKQEQGAFKCGNCGSRNTEYTQKQTRAADEPMTTFVLCVDCGKRWRFC